MFIAGKILSALLLPPGIFVVIALTGAILASRGKKKAATLLTISDAVLIFALSTGVASSLLISPLENKYPPITTRGDARAVIVLGGGFNESSPERGGAGSLTPISAMRASYGMELAKIFGLPLIYSGGGAYDSEGWGSEAEAGGRYWEGLGYAKDHITLETESKDTKGNANGIAGVAGKGPFILVTSAFHMPRAVYSFRKAGISVIPAPTDYRAKRSSITLSDFLPDTWKLECSRAALHEYLGLLYYLLT